MAVAADDGEVRGSAWARLSANGPRPLAAGADLVRGTGARARGIRSRASVGGRALGGAGTRVLDLDSWAKPARGPGWALSALVDETRPGAYAAVVRATAPAANAEGRWLARREGKEWTVSGGLTALPRLGPVRRAALEDCRARARPARAWRDGTAELDCRWRAELRPLAPRWAAAAPVSSTAPALAGSLRFEGSSDSRAGWRARADAKADPLGGWYRLDARATLEASGKGDERPRLAHSLAADLAVPRFEELVRLLDGTRFAVPAPFRVLRGPARASAESRGDPRDGVRGARWRVETDLASSRQRLKASASGTATLPPKGSTAPPSVDAEIVLGQAELELPRLGLLGFPKVALDRRIKGGEEEFPPEGPAAPRAPASKGPPLRLRASVRTESALLLHSNLARGPVPVALDLSAASPPASVSGGVDVRSFGIELFRRSAVVDYFKMKLLPGRRAGEIDGLIRYEASGAVIRIRLLGTTERPRVLLESDPPMDRQRIIALLVYGKPPSELDLEETASVGNTQTALESQAFHLASLVLFGSTPIERVAYDSLSQTYTVKLRLPGGASLELGSDFTQQRELRVRKLLAPHWAVESEVRQQTQTGETEPPAAYLEWFMRY